MLRLLLLIGFLLGFSIGLQRGWLVIRWDRVGQDLQQQINQVSPGTKNPPL